MLLSGNLPVEQMRNRLMERSKYLLPTGPDGLIISTYQQFQIEASRLKLKDKDVNFVIEFKVNVGSDKYKLIRFPKFTLTNKFPDNVCLLKNGSIVVCVDIIDDANVLLIAGFKFRSLKECYKNPFPSSKFHTYVASNIALRPSEWNVHNVAGKMYVTPHKFRECSKGMPDILVPSNKWFVSPLFHTLK